MDENQDQEPAGIEPLSPERRRRIMAGAAAVFTKDGYEGASMAHIAAAAQVSKGTLYNYFPGKEALFGAFVKDNCAELLQDMFGDMRDDVAVDVELTRIGKTMLKMMISPKALATFRVAVMEASKFPELARTFVESGPQPMVRTMAGWIARRVAAGELAVADVDFAAEQFFSLTQTRLVLRARIDAGYAASEAEIAHVVAGAVGVFLAAYQKPAL